MIPIPNTKFNGVVRILNFEVWIKPQDHKANHYPTVPF